MNESGISPLAKRLAEENNVNWQSLKGSGDTGKVVERDVLEYLARVMAGEEDLNPTAEPVPDGMEAWPEDDVIAFSQEQGAVAISEPSSNDAIELVDEDLIFEDDSFITGGDTIQAQGDQSLIGEEVSIDEDIFLFDDEDDLLTDVDEVTMASATQTDTLDDDLFRTLADEEDQLDFSTRSETTDIIAGGITPIKTHETDDLFIDDVEQVTEEATSSFEKVLEATDESIVIDDVVSTPIAPIAPPAITEIPVLLQGNVLRRYVQVGALLEIQESIVSELNLSGLNLTTFLVKASAKALETHSLGTGNEIALMNFTKEKISIHLAENSLDKDFKALIETLDEAKQNEEDVPSASLLVADLSGHKLDEVMLSKEVPVLSLGLIVSEGNSHQSTLSLSGNVVPDQGTAFLERVAELLSEPVRLII